MDQDTRKDRRVKIVSLNVRYKSATVDEFIENHAHDVSRGGIYIKTASPFPSGTLLKFEIRLASDQAVIAGVGRVVWKREAGPPSGERPAGMGVKFIKIDEPSKTVIDRLVSTRPDAGKAFESEAEMPATFNDPPAAKPAPTAGTVKIAPPAAGTPRVLPPRKATMMGLGIPTLPPPPTEPSSRPPVAATVSTPRAPSSGGMFPSTDPDGEMPAKQDQTVMKQAAELLEEALREAGGSMEEIGTNPLFSGTASPPATRVRTSSPPAGSDRARAASPVPEVKGPSPTEKRKPSVPPVEVKTPSIEPGAKARDADDAARARAMVAGMAPAPRKAPPEALRSSRESGAPRGTPVPASVPGVKKGGGGAFIVLFVVVAAVAAVVVMYRGGYFGGGATPAPTATASAVASAPSATASAVASAEPSPSQAASASPEPAMSAGGAPSASEAPIPSAAATASAATTTTASAATTTTASAATAPVATARPTPVPTAAVVWTAPAPRPTATATATPATPPAAAPAPRPKPKPADDNPY
jgi:uncharacterized protein (TIGR02266 family)